MLFIKNQNLTIILLLSFLVIICCYDKEKEQLYTDLNTLGNEITFFIGDFNNLKYDSNKKAIQNDYNSMNKYYNKVYEGFIKNKNKIHKKAFDYFRFKYIISFELFSNAFDFLLESNKQSKSIFIEKYNETGKKINDFVEKHNSLIDILENID